MLTTQEETTNTYIQDSPPYYRDIELLELAIHISPSQPGAYDGYVVRGVILELVKAGQVDEYAAINISCVGRRRVATGPDRERHV